MTVLLNAPSLVLVDMPPLQKESVMAVPQTALFRTTLLASFRSTHSLCSTNQCGCPAGGSVRGAGGGGCAGRVVEAALPHRGHPRRPGPLSGAQRRRQSAEGRAPNRALVIEDCAGVSCGRRLRAWCTWPGASCALCFRTVPVGSASPASRNCRSTAAVTVRMGECVVLSLRPASSAGGPAAGRPGRIPRRLPQAVAGRQCVIFATPSCSVLAQERT